MQDPTGARDPAIEPASEIPTSGIPQEEARARRARRRHRARAARRHRRLRFAYFALAAVWGFVSGSAAVLGGMVLIGRPLDFSSTLLSLLVIAGLVAVVGGAVTAAAYREAVRRAS